MSIIAYPLEATEYTAADVQTYLSTRTSGVSSKEITLTPEGMTATISPFLAWFNYAKFKGCSVAVTEPVTLNFEPAHATHDRIDRVALTLDLTKNNAHFTIFQGVPASKPVPSEIRKTETIYDISPFYVRIRAGATEITPDDITNTILDYDVCGIMRDSALGETDFMLNAVYDPLQKSKEMAFKDETPIFSQSIDDCNAAINTGWYVCELNCKNTPDKEVFRYASLDVVRRGATAIYQTITYEYISARRYGTSSDNGATWSWKGWEWVNPPMVSNVEYRTTERYNKQPVYIQDVPFGALPNTASAAVTIPKDLEVISIEGYCLTGKYTIPLSILNSINSVYYNSENGTIHIETKSNASSVSATLIVKYTK